MPVSEGLKRANSSSAADRLEKEDLEFHEKVKNGFLKIARENSERFNLITDGKDIDTIHAEISEIVSRVFKWF